MREVAREILRKAYPKKDTAAEEKPAAEEDDAPPKGAGLEASVRKLAKALGVDVSKVNMGAATSAFREAMANCDDED